MIQTCVGGSSVHAFYYRTRRWALKTNGLRGDCWVEEAGGVSGANFGRVESIVLYCHSRYYLGQFVWWATRIVFHLFRGHLPDQFAAATVLIVSDA